MTKKPYLILMVGLPGSGKSTIAELLKNEYEESVIVSTDTIREEVFKDVNNMDNNSEVFKIAHERIKDSIKSGKTTIVDCCNISMKSRRPIIDIGKKLNCTICAYIVPTLIDECYRRNKSRDRQVPDNVIERMHKGFQIPFYDEGFDVIKIHYVNEPKGSVTISELYEPCKTFTQDNPNHPEDLLWLHMEYVYKKFCKEFNIILFQCTDIDRGMLLGIILHDIGKLFTKKVDEEGIAHFFSHANVGSYYLLSTLTNYTLENVYIKSDILLDMCFIPNYHMLPYSWNNEKTHKKYENIFGWKLYDMLMRFHNIDKLKIDKEGNNINEK